MSADISRVNSALPELRNLEKILPLAQKHARVEVLERVRVGNHEFPIYGIVVGSEDRKVPTFGVFGGVHGLERVGSQVAIAYLESLFAQMEWDRDMVERFKAVRLVSIPIVNPGGMHLGWRANPNGVDLMRNAPIEATVSPWPLIGGHRISPRLPYFRGMHGMEAEARALVDFARKEMFEAQCAIALDLHSGFGALDRLWYPYAKTTMPYPRHPETIALADLFTRSFPNHVYRIEPQSISYTTHGDIWDYLFDEHYAGPGQNKDITFVPWTLEMGSWLWVRKNPAQLLDPMGIFNPVKEHRLRRTLRRHLPLLDFLLRAVKHHEVWGA